MIAGHEYQKRFFYRCNHNISSWLFVGSEGIGKFSLAKELAYSVLGSSNSNDLKVITSGNIGSMREILKFLTLKASNTRIVIINDAHLMNHASQNCILKALEEPNQPSLIFLISKTAASLLPALRSRLCILHFKPLSIDNLITVTGIRDENLLCLSSGSAGIALQINDKGGYQYYLDILKQFTANNITLEKIDDLDFYLLQLSIKRVINVKLQSSTTIPQQEHDIISSCKITIEKLVELYFQYVNYYTQYITYSLSPASIHAIS